MDKREFYRELVVNLNRQESVVSHTNTDSNGNPYQVTTYVPLNKDSTVSDFTAVIRCHKNVVTVYRVKDSGGVSLDSRLELMVETDWNTGYKPNMVAITISQVMDLLGGL